MVEPLPFSFPRRLARTTVPRVSFRMTTWHSLNRASLRTISKVSAALAQTGNVHTPEAGAAAFSSPPPSFVAVRWSGCSKHRRGS
jgi:hypothetical protein